MGASFGHAGPAVATAFERQPNRPFELQPSYGAVNPMTLAKWMAVAVVGPKPVKVNGRVPVGTQFVVTVAPIGTPVSPGISGLPAVHVVVRTYAMFNGRNWAILQVLPGYLVDWGSSIPAGTTPPQPGDYVLAD